MLENKLKTIERKTFDEQTKNLHVQLLNDSYKKKVKKHKVMYSATLVLFAMLLFIFIQTIGQSPTPTASQQQATFEMREITKAYYLYTKRPDRMYNLASPFYMDKLATTDQAILKEFEVLFENAEMEPFKGDLTHYPSSIDYLFQLASGESVYLKEIEDNGHLFFVNPKTMMHIKLPEENINQFVSHWLHIYMEKNEFPPWKIGMLTLFLIIGIYRSIKIPRKTVPEQTGLSLINISCIGLTLLSFYILNDWLGVNHFLFILLIFVFFVTVAEYLNILLKKQEPNWKNHLQLIFSISLFLFILYY